MIALDTRSLVHYPGGSTGRDVDAVDVAFDPGSSGWDNPTVIVTLDEKRRLTVPLALAPAAPGDAFDARFDEEEDTLIFRRVKRGKSWLDVLKACPVSMNDLPPRRREYPRKRKR